MSNDSIIGKSASRLNFDPFASAVADRFSFCASSPLFRVDAGDLYELYLDSFADPVERQHHTCHCCRRFIEQYGNLAIITPEGDIESALWELSGNLPEEFRRAADTMARAVKRGKVISPWVSSERTYGTPVTGEWHHFAVVPTAVHTSRAFEPHQVMAQKVQDFGTLSHGLADFSRDLVVSAVNLLEADAFFRGDKFIAPARFLLALHDTIKGTKGERRKNLIWRAVATAPVGFATPRSSMIGTLLEDLATGAPLAEVKARFGAKMNPLQYLRPQAAPTAGNIKQAEALVEKLGIAPALRRRFARLDEVQLIWSPAPAPEVKPAGGVFGHLLAERNPAPGVVVPTQTITWVKFRDTVLPKALKIEANIVYGRAAYVGVLTAAVEDAPLIFQWDNPVSWYLWNGGSAPSSWNLTTNSWVNVPGIMLNPSLWGGKPSTHNTAIAILAGATETRAESLAIFPETLRSEMHQVRSTIEAFSRSGEKEGLSEGSANGILIAKDGCQLPLRVTTDTGSVIYKIDRWD